MKKFLMIMLVLGAISSYAVASDDTKVEQNKLPLVKCSEPSITVALGTVDCKAQACENPSSADPKQNILASLFGGSGGVQGVGKGLGNMFTTALKETKCFKIVDLEKYEKIKKQLEATGQTVKPPKIDQFINLTITQLELSRSSGALGGGFIPIIGAIKKDTQSAEIGVDVSTMDPATLEISEAKSFKANSEKTSWGLFGGTGGYGGAVGGGWSWSNNLALDTVARQVIVEATNYLAETYAKDKIAERPVIKDEKNSKEKQQQNETDAPRG
jgi:curli biogenesis system outer membrane secretion channel CsgG